MSIARRRARFHQQGVAPDSMRWILRMLVPLGGLAEWVAPEDRDFDQAAVRARLRELHKQAERRECTLPPVLRANVAPLAALAGMSASVLDDAAETLGNRSSSKIVDVRAMVLDLSTDEVRSALGSQGVLARSGPLNVGRSGSTLLRDMVAPSGLARECALKRGQPAAIGFLAWPREKIYFI